MERETFSYRVSSSPSLFGTDDPSVVEEHQVLLSQFMSFTSHRGQEPPRGNHKSEPPRPNGRRPITPNDLIARPTPAQKSPLRSALKPPHPEPLKDRFNMAQSRVDPRRPARAQTSSDTPRDRIKVKKKKSEKKTVILPTSRAKIQARSTTPAPGQSQPASTVKSTEDSPKRGRIRRSGRARTGPTNYYQTINLYLSGSEAEGEPFVEKSRSSSSSSLSEIQATQSLVYPSPRCTADPSDQGGKRKPGSLGGLLRRRELGYDAGRQVRSSVAADFRASRSWKGASNDIIVLAWSPDGTKFAAGATAQCDEHNMEYNRRNNLLLGDLTTNCLDELPDHWLPRLSQRAAASRVVNDSRLYMSVTAMQWFNDTLYTASYDNTVKIWHFPENKPTCYKSLKHGSKVEVMARSNLNENILATGTSSVGLWLVEDSAFIPLQPPQQLSKKGKELVSTSLAWGIHEATTKILLAGMSEREDSGVPQNGLLAAWEIAEASTMPMQFSPNSQSIFDIKWHPTLPWFATASSVGQSMKSKHARSVVSLYEPQTHRTRTKVFECPALDMNDITFCPMNTNYMTASCTDGVTYVWDTRKEDRILHQLRHGEPLNQIDETIPKEQADVGVRVALWGDQIDEFYTGSSDGLLKRWDILRGPEDLLVQNVAAFSEEIMCGAFSPDKSNLLIGDCSGGLSLLSSGPFANDETLEMRFRRCGEEIPAKEVSEPESGVQAARELLSSGQIVRDPIYGPGQGPRYKGPFGAWARPKGTPLDEIAQTPLLYEWQQQQLSGVHPRNRLGLNKKLQQEIEGHIQLAQVRNQWRPKKRKKAKRTLSKKVAYNGGGNFIDLARDDDDDDDDHLDRWTLSNVAHKSKRPVPGMFSKTVRVEAEIIDLTGDTDDEESATENVAEDAKPAGATRAWATITTDHDDDLGDDFWWPENHLIEPNFED